MCLYLLLRSELVTIMFELLNTGMLKVSVHAFCCYLWNLIFMCLKYNNDHLNNHSWLSSTRSIFTCAPNPNKKYRMITCNLSSTYLNQILSRNWIADLAAALRMWFADTYIWTQNWVNVCMCVYVCMLCIYFLLHFVLHFNECIVKSVQCCIILLTEISSFLKW